MDSISHTKKSVTTSP